jgi:hypothetical protein
MEDMALVAEDELQGLNLVDIEIEPDIPVETAIVPVERETGGKGNPTDAALPNGLRDIQKELTAIVSDFVLPEFVLFTIANGGRDIGEHGLCGDGIHVNVHCWVV